MTDRPGIDVVYQENRVLCGEIERLRAELTEKDKRIEELKLEMEPWVRALGLLTTLKADLEIDAEHPGLMAREIFKWVKEKDKCIEGISKERDFWAITAKQYKDQYNDVIRHGPGHIITYEQLASGEVVLLTQGQIDAAWKSAWDEDSLDWRWAAERALEEIDRLRAECIDLKTDLQGHMDAVAELRAEHIDLKKVNDSVVSLKLEMEPWVRALGLLTTLKADLEIDAEHPGLMAREILKWVKEKDKRIEELEGDLFTVLDDNTELSNDHKPHDIEPVYATLHFYHNDADSMRRFRLCNQAEGMKLVLWELDQWLRNKIKYNDADLPERQVSEEGLVLLQIVRDQLNDQCEDYGIDIWDD